jgi:signal transduction histidine kinase
MQEVVVESLLHDRKIAYALTDRQLRVVVLGGAAEILVGEDARPAHGSLFDMVPELVGCEVVLGDILSGRLPRFELAWVNREMADGREGYLTMVDLPYRDHGGQIAGLIHLVEDVTEMGILQQQLAQHRNELRLLEQQLTLTNQELTAANAELQRLDALKSVFISVAAHELRSPLASILGFLEVVLDEEPGSLSAEQREYLQIVRGSTQRLLGIAKGLLDATRIEAGRIELALEPTDLKSLAQSVIAEHKPQLLAKGQRLLFHASPGLPTILCDQTRAAQIIGNLVDNACKYTARGGCIHLDLTHGEEEGFVQVSVADNGVGISATDQEKVFERFFRAEGGLTAGVDGAGMGLYITRSLVEMHGGRIWFESKLDRGSTFHVTFPIADQSA